MRCMKWVVACGMRELRQLGMGRAWQIDVGIGRARAEMRLQHGEHRGRVQLGYLLCIFQVGYVLLFSVSSRAVI